MRMPSTRTPVPRGELSGHHAVRSPARLHPSLRRLGLLLALCLALGIASEAMAQTNRPLAPLDVSSPAATVESFLDQARNIEGAFLAYRAAPHHARARAFNDMVARAATLFDTSNVPPAFREEVADAAFGFLFDILLRLPPQDLARALEATAESDPQSPWLIPGTEIAIMQVAEGERAGSWLFSPRTLARLPEFHRAIIDYPLQEASAVENWHRAQSNLTGPFFSDDVIDRLPGWLTHTRVLDTALWKLLLTLAIWLAIALLLLAWMQALSRLTANMGMPGKLFAKLSTPVLMAVMVLWARSFVELEISLSGGASARTERAITLFALYVAAAWAIWLTLLALVESAIATPFVRGNPYHANLLRLVGKVLALSLSAFLLILGLNEVGVPALGLVAGLGVGGVAVALAGKSTIENLFGGLTLFADKPFRVGHFVDFQDGQGFVENIGPRSSRLRGLDGSLTTVPNAELVNARIINYSERDKCMFLKEIGLRYETEPEQLERLLADIRATLLAHPMIERSPGMPRVNLIEFGDTAIRLEVRAHVMTNDYARFLEIQEALLLEIMRLVERSGARLATRAHTVFISRDGSVATEAEPGPARPGLARAAQDEGVPRTAETPTGR